MIGDIITLDGIKYRIVSNDLVTTKDFKTGKTYQYTACVVEAI